MSNQAVSVRRPLRLLALPLLCGCLSLGVASVAAAQNNPCVLEPKLDALEGKVDAAEGKLDALEGKADVLGADVGNLEAKADVLEAKIDTLLGIDETVERIETEIIDNACLANERKPSLYLPLANGGQLELVKQRVLQVIQQVTATGETTNNAFSKITLGNFYTNAGMIKKAYSTYCQALCLAVSLPGESPRCLAPPF